MHAGGSLCVPLPSVLSPLGGAGQRNPVPRDAFEMYTVEMGRNDDMQYSQEYKVRHF